MTDKAEGQEVVVGDGSSGVVAKEEGQEVVTKVMGSKTVSSKKTVTKKVMKTTSKSSSSSSSSSSKKTTTSSSSSAKQQEQSKDIESSGASSETSQAVSESTQSTSEQSHSTSETSSNSVQQHSSDQSKIDGASTQQSLQTILPSEKKLKIKEKQDVVLTSDNITTTPSATTLATTGAEERTQKQEDTAEQHDTQSDFLHQEEGVASNKVSETTSKSSKMSSNASKTSFSGSTTSSSKDHKLLICSSEDLFKQLSSDQNSAEQISTNQTTLQILQPSHQTTTTVLSPQDLTPKPGWMGEISFDLTGFLRDSIDVHSDGCRIEVHATKASLDELGDEKKEQYARICQLPESPIDPSKMNTSLFQDGVMTIIVPSIEVVVGCTEGVVVGSTEAVVVGTEVMVAGGTEDVEKILKDKQDFILTSDKTNATAVLSTDPPANSTDYSKAYSSASRSVIVKKDGHTLSQIQISRSGEAAANVTKLTPLLPSTQSGVEAFEENALMHFNVSGFEGESIEVCSDGRRVEVKATRTSVDEEGAERKEEFARVYDFPAPIDPCQLHPSLSQDGVLSLQVDSELVAKEGGVSDGGQSEEVREEMVKRAESKQARQTDTGAEERTHKQEDTAAQHHTQSVSQDGAMESSKSFKSSSSSSSSSKVISSSTHQVAP